MKREFLGTSSNCLFEFWTDSCACDLLGDLRSLSESKEQELAILVSLKQNERHPAQAHKPSAISQMLSSVFQPKPRSALSEAEKSALSGAFECQRLEQQEEEEAYTHHTTTEALTTRYRLARSFLQDRIPSFLNSVAAKDLSTSTPSPSRLKIASTFRTSSLDNVFSR
jgi:hypothetical protein